MRLRHNVAYFVSDVSKPGLWRVGRQWRGCLGPKGGATYYYCYSLRRARREGSRIQLAGGIPEIERIQVGKRKISLERQSGMIVS